MNASMTDQTAQHHLRAVLKNAPIALLAFNPDGVCIMAEGSLLSRDAIPRHLVGSSLGEIASHFGVAGCDSYIDMAVEGDTVVLESTPHNLVLECRFEPIGATDHVTGGLVVVTDVSERAALMRATDKHSGPLDLDIENELRAAVRLGQLRLHYQPVVRLADARVVGAEALVRWQHPRRGLLSPAEFIPIAESTGLIVPIGEWAIEEACRHARLCRKLAGLEDFAIAVNVSARQLTDDHIVQTVRRALEANDLPADALWLEVTETVLMADEDEAEATLSQLHDEGVRLAIDDFGTGYSSLSNLRKFQFDALKIDRSFVAGLTSDEGDDAAIVAAIVALAHSLGIRVIAEGVETREQAEKLAHLRCDDGQGHLWGRSLPAGPASLGDAATTG